jgi:signal transduction histidine kinase
MNKIKGSLPLKIMVHIILFISGLIVFVGTYHTLKYLDSYSVGTNSFYETSDFQSKYLKYVERVAVYVDYRERGYTGNVSYNSDNINLKKLFEKEVEKPKTPEAASEQDNFDYYNTILNNANTNFIYYVINLSTGAKYYSPSLESFATSIDDEEDILASMDEYMKKVEKNPAYLIINTATERYATNVNRNYQYLNDENLQWVMDYIAGEISNTFSDSRDEYLICTSIDIGFPNAKDEFGTLYTEYQRLYSSYKESVSQIPLAFLFLLLFLVVAITTSGYKKGVNGIYLIKFDQLFTEAGFFITVGILLATSYFGIYLKRFISDQLHMSVTYGLTVFYILVYPFAMFGFLSLVRRLKASELFTNSILIISLKYLVVFLKDFFRQKSFTYRVAGLLFIFIGIQVIALFTLYHPESAVYNTLFSIILTADYVFLSMKLLKAAIDYNKLNDETKKLTEGDFVHKIPVEDMCFPAKTLGNYVNRIGDGLSLAVEEKLKSERLKTELITNVSHDIKTPLTSIINYIDLLRKEDLKNEKAAGYLDVLSSKSWRLKNLIEDLVEVSKASSGNITLHLESLNIVELVKQAMGEFEDRFINHRLDTIVTFPSEPIYIKADGRSTYRIIENIFSNVNKYALEGTRVYVDIVTDDISVTVSVKNISKNKLNITSEELVERFVRGDTSRNTEGSGLGLSIAQSLAALQDAVFDIVLDGDLFKAVVKFKLLTTSSKDNL